MQTTLALTQWVISVRVESAEAVECFRMQAPRTMVGVRHREAQGVVEAPEAPRGQAVQEERAVPVLKVERAVSEAWAVPVLKVERAVQRALAVA